MTRFCLLLTTLLFAGNVSAEYADRDDVQAFIDELVAEGLDRDHVSTLLAGAQRQESILESIARPAERTMSWGEYQRLFIQEERIQQGEAFWREHREWFDRAEQTSGVPAEIILAIIGVETRYGRHKGNWRVIDALATLGFDYPPRAAFFREELKHLFRLEKEAGIDPMTATGSYAGAMGYPQFISSSYRAYAVDFNDDGRIDLLNSPADAIGSVANYLREHRWQKGLPVAARARIEGNDYGEMFSTDYRLRLTLAEAANQGASPLSCEDNHGFCFDLPADTRVAALELDGANGAEFWFTTNNFYAITRYNHSHLYAMAVYQLSRKLAERIGD